MLKIIGMPKDALLGLCPDSLKRPGSIQLLTEEEVVYIAETLGAFWKYDYEAAKCGKVGLHAELKSLLHSDGFFISRILLEQPNIRTIMADQQVMRFNQLGIPRPDWVAGIPDGATELGKDLARISLSPRLSPWSITGSMTGSRKNVRFARWAPKPSNPKRQMKTGACLPPRSFKTKRFFDKNKKSLD